MDPDHLVVSDEEPPRPTTLADVARAAGVSKGTASKAISGAPGIGPATRERVQEVAERLSFRPSAIARQLATGRTGTVGVLTNDLEGRFVLPIVAGAEDALGAGRISVLLCDAREDPIREQQHLATLLDRRIDGLIVVGGGRTEPRPSLGRGLGLPVVYVYAPSDSPDDVSLTADDVAGGRVAAGHLADLGRTRIGFVGGDPSYIASLEREAGARALLEERDTPLLEGGALHGDWSERWGRAATRRLLDLHPDVDGLVCASDTLARGALDVLRDAGRRVPDDVAVVGYDNWGVIAENSRPTLTSVDMDLHGLGRAAAARIFAALSGGVPIGGAIRMPVRLVPRGSTIGGASEA